MDIKAITDELNRRHSVGTETGNDWLYHDAVELIEALKEYAQHKKGCPARQSHFGHCTCGLQEALKEGKNETQIRH